MASINSSVVYTEIHTLATNKAAPDQARSRIDRFCNDIATSQLTANVRVMSNAAYMSKTPQLLISANRLVGSPRSPLHE